MDRAVFFKEARRTLFGGKLSAAQVDGMSRVLDYRDAQWPAMIDEELAYLLATAYHETGRKMQPVREGGGERYLRAKPYYPWYARGLAGITWKRNYLKWGLSSPDDALQWPNALRVIFEGMIHGSFTGYKLADFISKDGQNYVGAREIINGHDRAKDVADYAEAFMEALHAARAAPDASSPTILIQETHMGPLETILNMVVGNPLTGIPGAVGVCATAGPALVALGDMLIEVGAGSSFWSAGWKFIHNPNVYGLATSFGLVVAKDHNVSGSAQ